MGRRGRIHGEEQVPAAEQLLGKRAGESVVIQGNRSSLKRWSQERHPSGHHPSLAGEIVRPAPHVAAGWRLAGVGSAADDYANRSAFLLALFSIARVVPELL